MVAAIGEHVVGVERGRGTDQHVATTEAVVEIFHLAIAVPQVQMSTAVFIPVEVGAVVPARAGGDLRVDACAVAEEGIGAALVAVELILVPSVEVCIALPGAQEVIGVPVATAEGESENHQQCESF